MKIKILIAIICCIQSLKAQDIMTLSKAVELALNKNLDLQIAGNEAEQAHNSNHPGNAGMLPSVSMNVSENPALANINQKFTNGTTIEKNNVFSNSLGASLVFTYTLFDGKKMFATKRKLESMDAAAVNLMHIRMQEVITSVIVNYNNIIRMNRYLIVLNQLQELSIKRLEIVNSRILAGIANNSDLYLAQLDLETTKQNVIQQNMLIKNAYIGLNLIINVKADSMYTVESDLMENPVLNKTEMDSMLKHNPEWMLADDQCRIALQAQKEISAAKLPLIKLNGAYNYNLSQSQAGFSLFNQSTGPQAGLTLSIPLFTGNVNQVNQDNAKLNLKNSTLKKEQVMMNLTAMYEQAWQEYTTARLRLASDSISVKTAKEYMELMQERFSLGQNTILELKEAQRTYEDTYYRYISNLYVARIAETQLLGLTGQLVKYK